MCWSFCLLKNRSHYFCLCMFCIFDFCFWVNYIMTNRICHRIWKCLHANLGNFQEFSGERRQLFNKYNLFAFYFWFDYDMILNQHYPFFTPVLGLFGPTRECHYSRENNTLGRHSKITNIFNINAKQTYPLCVDKDVILYVNLINNFNFP